MPKAYVPRTTSKSSRTNITNNASGPSPLPALVVWRSSFTPHTEQEKTFIGRAAWWERVRLQWCMGAAFKQNLHECVTLLLLVDILLFFKFLISDFTSDKVKRISWRLVLSNLSFDFIVLKMSLWTKVHSSFAIQPCLPNRFSGTPDNVF